MAYFISDDCIRCHSCIPVCPSTAIYKSGETWAMADGTKHFDRSRQAALSGNTSYIVSSKCTECIGLVDGPKCASVCPVGASSPDPNFAESKEQLIEKIKLLGI